MATATPTTGRAPSRGQGDDDQCIVIEGLDWKGYSTMLRVKGDRRHPKLLYLDGSLWLMTPGIDHEWIKIRVDRFVYEVTVEVGLRFTPSGSTTFRRKAKRGGFEPDQSYYLASTLRRSAPNRVDLRDGPPPDLVDEVVYTHAVEDTIEVCRRLRVPEMWLCDERSFRILALGPDGKYSESAASVSLPFLTGKELDSRVRRPFGDDETAWARELRAWVRDVLAPRVRGANP